MLRDSPSIGMDRMARLLCALGLPAFDVEFSRLAREHLGADHVICLTYSDSKGVDCLLNAGNVESRWAQRLTQLYVEKYFRLDPNMAEVVAPLDRTRHSVIAFDPARLTCTQYRTLFWRRSPFDTKCSLIFFDEAMSFYCNFYRERHSPPFSRRDCMEVDTMGEFLAVLIKAHSYAMRRSAHDAGHAHADRRNLYKPVDLSALSAREKLMMELILVGQNNEAIALDQSISINTVKTYRKRLYRKLNVSSLNELHARVLRSAQLTC